MRRRFLTIAIFLLAGAVVNVGVAWWIVFRGDPYPMRGVPHHPRTGVLLDGAEAADAWKRLKSADWPANPPVHAEVYRKDYFFFGGTTLEITYPGELFTPVPGNPYLEWRVVKEWRVGLPCRSLRSVGRKTHRQVNYPGAWRCAIALPLLPILPGFLINTLFYAGILWLVIPGPFVLRRLLRVRRGLCPLCKYPIGVSVVCTECGRDLPKASEASNVRRRLLTIAILLLAGAVVNVGVTWRMAASVNRVISKRQVIIKRQVSRTDDGSPVVLLKYHFVVTAGWPLSCGSYEYSSGSSWPKVLPLRPLWPAFAVNTLFYAAILWLLIPGPFALRRLIRRRRGLCPACGYDLRHAEHEACPECGLAA